MIFNLTQPVLDSAPKFTYTGTYEYIDDGEGNWRIKFLTSGVFTPLKDMTIDAFLVGGGAGGMNNASSGGGGGYTNTVKNIELPANANFNIVIGAGGDPSGNGGETSVFELTAAGGNGKDGGSGGGAFGSPAGAGGSDGSDGGSGTFLVASIKGGTGQGTTTREFGEATGELYSGGGGGATAKDGVYSDGGLGGGGRGTAGARNGENGQENTGGGGGGTYSKRQNGGYGGSGIVVIRKHKEAAA